MNILPKAIIVALFFSAIALGHAQSGNASDGAMSPAKRAVANTVTPQPAVSAQSPSTPGAAAAAASAKWNEIKDSTYDARDAFFIGLNQLEAAVDVQIRALAARRAAMKSTADTKEWDFAMKEMNDARSYLRSVSDESRKASVEAWNQQKETVGRAWVRTQEAYDAVIKSTTS
jgi:hypothetical protein